MGLQANHAKSQPAASRHRHRIPIPGAVRMSRLGSNDRPRRGTHACVILSTKVHGECSVSRGRAAPREELRLDVPPRRDHPAYARLRRKRRGRVASRSLRIGGGFQLRNGNVVRSSRDHPPPVVVIAGAVLQARRRSLERHRRLPRTPLPLRRGQGRSRSQHRSAPTHTGGERRQTRERNGTSPGRLTGHAARRHGQPRQQLVVGGPDQGPDDVGAAARGDQFPEDEGAQADAQGWFVFVLLPGFGVSVELGGDDNVRVHVCTLRG